MNKKIIFIIIVLTICFSNKVYAEDTNNNVDTNSIISSQSSSLDISSFISETKKYSTDILDGIDTSTILSDALTGKIDNSKISKNILSKFFKELLSSVAAIVSIIIIIIIHSILKNISDGLENKSVSQITYFVTYILIVAIMMKNFSDVITTIKSSIESLVGFINCLLPILMTLMVATR